MIAFGLIIKNIFGWLSLHWRVVLYIAAGIALLLLIVFTFKACNKPEMSMTEEEKQEVLNDIEDRNEGKLKEKLVEIEVKEKVIEGNVANADAEKVNAIAESKKKWANANISELQAEFNRRMQ